MKLHLCRVKLHEWAKMTESCRINGSQSSQRMGRYSTSSESEKRDLKLPVHSEEMPEEIQNDNRND